MKRLRTYFKDHPFWAVTFAVILAMLVYWNLLAARRYVSESHVVVDQVQFPGLPGVPEVPSLSMGGALPPRDVLLLRDYLLSADLLAKLESTLHLREHYSSTLDPFSRLIVKDGPFEWFLDHYRRRVYVEFDYDAGVLVIQAQAYSQRMAQDIAQAMVGEGGRFINEMAQNLARTQVAFAEQEVVSSAKRMAQSRQALIAYQNAHGLVSPTGTVIDLSGVVARLESELSTLEARRSALEAYLAPSAPDLVQVREQIGAIDKQLRSQRARLATRSGNALNRIAEEYDRLSIEAGFQQSIYQTAVTALERARIDAARTLKKVSIVQQPTLPQHSTEPGRLYFSAATILGGLLLAGILQLLIAVVREHRD